MTMTDSEEEVLKGLFSWDNRDIVLHIRFDDSEEFEMTVSGWTQDIGEEPHAHGTIIRTFKSERNWKSEDAVIFHLRDVASITNTQTREIIFQIANE